MTQKVLLWPPQGIYVPSPVLTNHYTITLECKDQFTLICENI